MTAHSPTPMPSFGPTVFELLPRAGPGISQGNLAKQVAVETSRARRDRNPDRERALKAAHDAALTPIDALVSELLTPPLPPSAAPRGPAPK